MADAGTYEAAEKFVQWLSTRLVAAGRGDDLTQLEHEPAGRFWLGRLAPEASVMARNGNGRGDRLEPCACGLRVQTESRETWSFTITVRAVAWMFSSQDKKWGKTERIEVQIPVELKPGMHTQVFGADRVTSELRRITGSDLFSAEVRVELSSSRDVTWDVQLVNTSSDPDRSVKDTNLYECELAVTGLQTVPFLLEALPDSFRYDRRVVAYGINGGVHVRKDRTLQTADCPIVRRRRPIYWNASDAVPDFSFRSVASNPVERGADLLVAMKKWGEGAWSESALAMRACENAWTESMFEQALNEAKHFDYECSRIEAGIEILRSDETVRRAFVLMNEAMSLASKHPAWRPFQLGYLLANLSSIVGADEDSKIVDIVWFATGGGKTETYLGMILAAAFFDRLTGKRSGVTAWSRFPLRMLSLQQTQRFADALAAGERVRQAQGLRGDPFSLGFFVGQGATPNSIKEDPGPGDFDYDDDDAVESMRVLLHCPFCRSESVRMEFDRRYWRLSHVCTAPNCFWGGKPLPFYIVDDEIYRFLPTVIVGTLDKAAGIAMQASMRGLVGPPYGRCSEAGHGYVYAPRAKRPSGCLVPGCSGRADPLDMDPSAFGPTFRLQDELHLLKDSLGAVDSHYEALYDGLQVELSGRRPKILASSATLEGYQRQVDILYRREARVFPLPGPSASEGFWTTDSNALMRQYCAMAPRGVTLDFAVDRLLTELQLCIRRLVTDPEGTCAEIGVGVEFAPTLVSLYGTNIVYGNTIRDLEAVARSAETQVAVQGPLNTATLTGRTDFDEVRQTLQRLEHPEAEFDARLHVVTASSMMSHGVDIDRLNIMVMYGLPLTTAEFIQATARVGRTWPGLVIVVHKIGRERDASMFRCFEQFVSQGDRLIEPIPITRRSRRVLERTVAGLALARLLMIHEPKSTTPLTTIGRVRDFIRAGAMNLEADADAVADFLKLDADRDEALKADLMDWYTTFGRSINDPPSEARFVSDVSPTGGPMRSLRDVEEQAPVHTRYSK